MIKIFSLCSVLLFLYADIDNNDTSECQIICWNENRQLVWDDFLGKADTAIYTYYGDTADVVSVLSIAVDLDSLDNYFVKAMFDTKSWYEKGRNKPLALKHEQGHFDLTEVYARHLRKRIKEEEYSDNFDINKIYQEVMSNLNEASNQYDVATAHGGIEPAQDNWSSKIIKRLNDINDYKDESEYCPCSNHSR